jgi:thiol-disulfide isomerase/thioredoxin
MTRSRDSRREAARAQGRSPRSRFLLPALGAGIVVVAAIAAIALGNGSNGGTASSPRPSVTGSPGPVVSGSAPNITGASLAKLPDTGADPAVGTAIPTVAGADFAGNPVAIEANGKPKVLLFLAHWCSHCQAEVPVVEAWLKSGGAPEGVDLVSVATGIDSTLPNYPPEEWLAREGWTMPLIVDRTGSVATAYGLSAFPFWVFVGADGKVTGRTTGELTIAELTTIITALPR